MACSPPRCATASSPARRRWPGCAEALRRGLPRSASGSRYRSVDLSVPRPQKPKRRTEGPPFSKIIPGVGGPGGTEHIHPGRNSLLLGFLGLLRLGLFRLLRFLSHSILSRFHGLNATPRHAWRRASLATSSIIIRPDSRAPAACRHGVVITLSTVVMGF